MTQAYSMTITEERLANIVNLHKNGPWQFAVCKNCKYEEAGTRLSKIVMAMSLVDRRDHTNQWFSVKVSEDGSVIYAWFPYHPQFLMEDFEKNFHNACPKTKLAHQAYAYKFTQEKRTIADCTQWIAYCLPIGCTVTINYFNNPSNAIIGLPTKGIDGLFQTYMKVGYNTAQRQRIQINNRQPSRICSNIQINNLQWSSKSTKVTSKSNGQ